MSIHSSSHAAKNGSGPRGFDGSSLLSTNSYPVEDPKFIDSVVKIQAAVKGYLVRKRLGESRLNHFTNWFAGETRRLMSQIKKVAEKVEASWQRHLVNQPKEVEAMDRLLRIRREIMKSRQLTYEFAEVNPAAKKDVDEFISDKTAALAKEQSDFMSVCEEVGFHTLKQGMKCLLGRNWKTQLPSEAVSLIEEYSMMFSPTGYTLFKVSEESDLFTSRLVSDSGKEIEEDSERLDDGKPYLTGFRSFESSNAMEEVEGAELNIPYVNGKGKACLLVFKGYFKRDPVNVSHGLEAIVRKRLAVEREFRVHESIPASFREAYLKQYPLRDLILKEPVEIAAELDKDYQAARSLKMEGILPSVLFKFAMSTLSEQIRTFSLLLMLEDPRQALFLYEMTAKQLPQYQQVLRNTLHFSLQKKLNLALEELEATKKKLQAMDASKTPYETRIAQSSMDDSAKRKAMEKVKAVNSRNHESSKAEKYLDTLLQVPFGTYTPEPVTRDSDPKEISQYLDQVEARLDKAVHGHKESKDAVLEWIAQRISNGESNGECIAFQGPPGVGKTTLAKEGIAKALDRPFAFISLGGQSDASYLIGHGFTYVGSDWGRIVEILKESKCMDPVIYIDEVDKVSNTPKGKELIGVLTALTDFSQNNEFQDKYFSGIKFDLSKALFIFSYNDPSRLDPIFKDRLKIIKIGAQSVSEKQVIAAKYLLPDILRSCGFSEGEVTIDEENLKFLIENYTFEAGVRKLKENLFAIVRQLNLLRLRDPQSITLPYEIDRDSIVRFRKDPKVEFKRIAPKPAAGTVNGLYATTAGVGGLTIIQAFKTLSKERMELTLTGSQGKVMQESMSVARSVVWNLLPADVKMRIQSSPPEGLHIHCPEGATPKDGPSAGGAITLAILSQVLGVPVKNDVAMTGEIDLTGNITKIGGLSAKLQGAKKAGVRLALVPRDNAKDLEEIKSRQPDLLDESFQVEIVDTIYDILDHALVRNPIERPEGMVLLTEEPPKVSDEKI